MQAKKLLLAASLIATWAWPSQAAELPAGKSVRLVVGAQPGGGTDHAARLIAHFIARQLPGRPSLVVQNMPGAGGITALNHFFQRAERDGLVLVLGSSSALVPDAVRHNPAVLYDPTRLAFVGGIAGASRVLLARRTALAAMPQGRAAVVAQVGAARIGAQMALWSAAYLGWNIRWVSGYAGSTDLANALLRGEADITDTAALGKIAAVLQEPGFTAVAQTGQWSQGRLQPRRLLPEVPLVTTLLAGKLDAPGEQAVASWLGGTRIGKFLALPPDSPPEMVALWRTAFTEMAADPLFQDVAAKELGPDYDLMSAADLEQAVGELTAVAEADLTLLTELRRRFAVPGAVRR